MDLTNQYISESFHSLLQISGSGIVTDGTGSIVNFLDVNVSSADTASYISPAFINSVVATGAGLAVTTGTNIFTGSQIFSGSLFPAGPYTSNTSLFSVGSPSASWKDVFAQNIYLVSGSKSASINLSGSNFIFDGGITIPTNQAFFGYLQGTASYAVNAGNSITSSFALSSSNAVNSVSASSSISSSFATTASYALNALSASQSTSASFAVTASYSLNALSASFSNTASFATSASNSVSASYALNANSASYSLNSLSASFATSASYAIASLSSSFAITASFVANAISASFASTASYVLNAISSSRSATASYAFNSVSSSYSDTALTATSASNALTASYVLNSVSASYSATASYVLNAISSSNAATASYILNAISSSYAVTASYTFNAVSSSFATTASYASSSLFSNTASYAISASNTITASYALTANTSSYAATALSSSYALTASFVSTASYAINSLSASYAITSSYALNANSASYANTSLSSSYAVTSTTASYALNSESSSYSTNAVTASYISPTFISASAAAAGFGSGTGTGNAFPYVGTAVITGSLIVTEKIIVSQSISASNINVGVPTSNAWQTNLAGSYFNNFTSNTDVSEILRFIAGLLSGSAPDASPNTRTYSSSLTRTTTNNGSNTIAGAVPQNSTAADIIYLTSKGFATAGTAIFNGITTVFTQSAYTNAYSSIASGSTTVSSSVDTQLFGLGAILNANTPNTFYVSGAINWRFEDNSSQTITATSQSQNLLSSNTFGTNVNGLTIGKISTANPSVIPPAYQDGKFASVFSSSLSTFSTGRSYTSVSSSGYYHISASIAIASGSSAYSTPAVSNERIFWAPISSITIPPQTITVPTVTTASLTLTSGSLSGAPYVRTATWTQNAQINGIFNPLYRTNVTVASMSISGAGALVTLSSQAQGSITCSILSNGNINTSNSVFDSTGVTARSTSTIPFETDIIKLSGSLSFNAGSSGATNITASSISPTTFVVSSSGFNRSGTIGISNIQTFNYHTAGTYGQPLSSGSMAYFGFPATSSLTATTEPFTDEANRIQLTDNILSFTGAAFISGSLLGTKDLQVKPGYLVDPGGSRRYWYPLGYGDTFKYYVRRFRRTTSISSFTLNIGQILVSWNDTTTPNGVSIGIIFKSSVSGSNNLTTTRLFDPSAAAGVVQNNITANTAGTNPFGVAIDLYGSRISGPAGNVYTVTLITNNSSIMNASAFDEFYLIVRYNGEPTTPVTSLNVSAGT